MIIGVDVGTSVTKAGLVSRNGVVSHVQSVPSRLIRRDGGIVEQDLEEVLQSVSAVVRPCVAAAEREGITVEAVAITAQGDGLWLRDADGRAVRPPISWSDGRASDRVAAWNRGGKDSIAQRVFDRTGSGIFPGSHAALIAELAEHEPESLRKATVAGYCADAIVFRLTGTLSVDASDASMPFLRIAEGDYDDEALRACGISEWKHLLQQPATPGALFTLNADGATLLGLPEGTQVTGGPYDLQACAFGAASFAPGDGCIVFGTTLATQVFTTDASVTPGDEPAGMWLRTPMTGLYQRVMPSMVGAASIAWLQGVLGVGHDELSELLEASSVGANGVRALSFFSPAGERAPFLAPEARGQFLGLSLETTRADLARALLEAVAFAARNCFDTLGGDGELTATGGAFAAAGAKQVFADVLGRPLHFSAEDLLGARGAALTAWRALGVAVPVESWRERRTTVQPIPENVTRYNQLYARYLADLAAAKHTWKTPNGGNA